MGAAEGGKPQLSHEAELARIERETSVKLTGEAASPTYLDGLAKVAPSTARLLEDVRFEESTSASDRWTPAALAIAGAVVVACFAWLLLKKARRAPGFKRWVAGCVAWALAVCVWYFSFGEDTLSPQQVLVLILGAPVALITSVTLWRWAGR